MQARRRSYRTKQSGLSIASALADMIENTARALENLAERFLDPAIVAQCILHQGLSISSQVSRTTTTLARNYEPAANDSTRQVFRDIGRGTCGQVFAIIGIPTVIKVPINTGQTERLYRDWCMHKRIEVAFNSVPSRNTQQLSIPVFEQWLAPDAVDFWSPYSALFPEECPSFGLISERIFPLPYPIRHTLFRSFAPPMLNEKECLALDRNTDCLVRIYMGRRMEASTRKEAGSFSLRNFELHLNEMEALGLPVVEYATVVADAYAVNALESPGRRRRRRICDGKGPKAEEITDPRRT